MMADGQTGKAALLRTVEALDCVSLFADALNLTDLPEDTLDSIVSLLDVEVLAAVAVQSRRLRAMTEGQQAWKQACTDRWDAFLVDQDMSPLPDTPSVWRSAFRTRISMPTNLARACDTARRAQQCARSDNPKASHACPAGKPIDLRRAFELTMRAVFEVGLAAGFNPEMHKNALVWDFEESLQWWMHKKPEVLMAFVREAESDLGQYDMWRMAFIHWPTIPWKRSALAYLPGLIAKVAPAWEHVSVLEALDREVVVLDNTMRSLENQGDTLSMIVPEGVPKKHWWWWME